MAENTNRLHGTERVAGLEATTVLDFWSWAYSDLLCNTVRPLFAEFMVGKALDVLHCLRLEWNSVDFLYAGKGVEVKSGGYLQTWKQRRLSTIVFDIAPRKQPWSAHTNEFGPPGRSADCYVFCVHLDTSVADCCVYDVSRWEFYVLGAELLLQHFGLQKSVTLSRLRQVCAPVPFGRLREQVDLVVKRGAALAAGAGSIGPG